MKKNSLLPKFAAASVAALVTQVISAQPALAIGSKINPGTGWATDIGGIINFALNFIMVIALFLVFFYLILGGIQWITSGGDKGKTEEARNKITAAVIGIIILAAAYAIVQFVAYILGFGDFSNAVSGIKTLPQSSK